MRESNYWMRGIGRRRLLRGGAMVGAGLAGAALIGCGGSDEPGAPAAGTTAPGGGTAAPAATATSEAAAARDAIPTTIAVPDTAPVDGGVLITATAQDIGSLDATKSGAIGNLQHMNVVYDSLLAWRRTTVESELDSRNLDTDIIGHLAESRETTPDGLTYTFHLRPGVKWQNVAPVNGRDFTSEDVVYAYERFGSEGVWQTSFEFVDRWETPDDLTVVAHMTRPSPDFIVPLAEQNLQIFPRELVEDGTIDRTMVGTGPLIVQELSAGQRMTYTTNPDYWGKKPHLEGREFRVMPDAAARLAAFRAEQVALGAASSLRDLSDIRGTNPDLQVYRGRPVKSTFGMVFNQSEPKWQDVRVRQALQLTIDRDEINELLYEGNGTTYPIIPYTHIFDRPPDASAGELGPWWRTDLAEAQKLLSAAGAEGLEIDYLIYRAYVGDQNDVWVDQLRRAGVTLNLREADYVEYNSQLAAVSYPDAIGAWDQHGTQADNYFRNQILSTSPGNWHHINDPELDDWAEQQSVELDPDARREIHRKIWDKVLVDVHRVEHTNPAGYALVHGWLHGMTWMIGNDGFSGTTFGYDSGKFFSDLWIDKA